MMKAAAPIPRMRPFLRWSNGKAASSTSDEVEAAPLAANPAPIHSHKSGPVTSSLLMTTTLSQRPVSSQSSATVKAAAVEAQARLIVLFGPLIPVNWAN